MTDPEIVSDIPQDPPLARDRGIVVGLLSALLFSIPLNYAFGSVAVIVFVATVLAMTAFRYRGLSQGRFWMYPVALFLIMGLSLFWTRDPEATWNGLRKESAFLFIPLAFLCLPWLGKAAIDKVFRIFGFSMAGYALYYLVRAMLRFLETGDKAVFFFHELVTPDVSAIYVSVFGSFALFYFIALPKRNLFEKVALSLLFVLVFLLSSKTVVSIDFILIIAYYLFFFDIRQGVRVMTVILTGSFLIFSVFFVQGIRDRFVAEFETMLVDNAVGLDQKQYNVTFREALNQPHFEADSRFSGVAMRLYQYRVFTEIVEAEGFLPLGYGLEASQEKIKQKSEEHGLGGAYGEYNFHNQYIQSLAELGIPGFLVLVAMLLYNLRQGWRKHDFLHVAFALTMMILFLTESFFCRQRGVLFFITLFCMFNLPQAETQPQKKA